jgi:hypothetical protein
VSFHVTSAGNAAPKRALACLFRLPACLLPLLLCACQGMYLHNSDRAAVAATAKKDLDSVDVPSIAKAEQENLAKLLAEEMKSIEARSKLVATLSLVQMAASEESLASHYRGALQKMKLALGDTGMLTLRDASACEKKKQNAVLQVSNLKRQLELLGASNVPPCAGLAAAGMKKPDGLSADDSKDFDGTRGLYAAQCKLLEPDCRVARKEAADLDAARKKLGDARAEAETQAAALKQAQKDYGAAVQANQKKTQAAAGAEKDIRDKAADILKKVNDLAEKSPALANRVKGEALVSLLTAAASGKNDSTDPELAPALEVAKSFPALAGSVENARAARTIVPVSHLLLALNNLTIQADRDARIAALDEEEIALLERKLAVRTTQAGLWRRYSDELCNLALLAAGKPHPEKSCDTIDFPDPLTCSIRFADPDKDPGKAQPVVLNNCVLQKSWRELFNDSGLAAPRKRALYEAAAAYLQVRLIAYATTVEEFRRIDIDHRRTVVNRETALSQWRNLVAVPIDELNGYYNGGIKPAELADLIVKAVGFTAIAIGVAK